MGAFLNPAVDQRPPEKPFIPATTSPLTGFDFNKVSPPAAIYLLPDDLIALRIFSNVVPETVNFGIVILRAIDGVLTKQVENIPVVTAGVPVLRNIQGVEGILLGVSAGATNSLTRGDVWVKAVLHRGSGTTPINRMVLFQDYCTASYIATWPGGNQNYPTKDPGKIRSITGTLPAAGAEISETVPTRTRWRPMTFRYRLVTLAAVANREANLLIDDGANILALTTPAFTQVANTTFDYDALRGVQRQAALQRNEVDFAMPDVILEAGYRIRTFTANLQAADAYTAPQYLVEEWVDLL